MTNSQAVVLLSGGIDSAVALAVAKNAGFDVYALSVRYGQRHSVELAAAARVAAATRVARHVTVEVGLDLFGGSALTDDAIQVPHVEVTGGIPSTYVPARNTVLLSLAVSWADALGATDVFIGANADDYAGYPDCRPEYFAAFAQMASLGTRAPVEIHTPLVHMSKVDIIRRGLELGVNFALTHSCYDPTGTQACGGCDACRLRLAAFTELGLPDPACRGAGDAGD